MRPKLIVVDWGAHAGLATRFAAQLNDISGNVAIKILPQYSGNKSFVYKILNFVFWISKVLLAISRLAFSQSLILIYTPPEYGSNLVQSVKLFFTMILIRLGKSSIICVKNVTNYEPGGCCDRLANPKFSNVRFALETQSLKERFSALFPELNAFQLPLLCQPDQNLATQRQNHTKMDTEWKVTVGFPGRINQHHKEIDELISISRFFFEQKIRVLMLQPDDSEIESMLEKFENVSLAPQKELSHNEYMQFFDAADILILPLNKKKNYFINKGSGSIYDAALLDKPVVAPVRYGGLIDEFVDFYYENCHELAIIAKDLDRLRSSHEVRRKSLNLHAEQVLIEIFRADT